MNYYPVATLWVDVSTVPLQGLTFLESIGTTTMVILITNGRLSKYTIMLAH